MNSGLVVFVCFSLLLLAGCLEIPYGDEVRDKTNLAAASSLCQQKAMIGGTAPQNACNTLTVEVEAQTYKCEYDLTNGNCFAKKA